MLTVNGFVHEKTYSICPYLTLSGSIGLEIKDTENEVVIKGEPVNFEYFVGKTGKYEFKAVFSKYTVESIEEE